MTSTEKTSESPAPPPLSNNEPASARTRSVLAGDIANRFHRQDRLRYQHNMIWRPSFVLELLLSMLCVLMFSGMAAPVL